MSPAAARQHSGFSPPIPFGIPEPRPRGAHHFDAEKVKEDPASAPPPL